MSLFRRLSRPQRLTSWIVIGISLNSPSFSSNSAITAFILAFSLPFSKSIGGSIPVPPQASHGRPTAWEYVAEVCRFIFGERGAVAEALASPSVFSRSSSFGLAWLGLECKLQIFKKWSISLSHLRRLDSGKMGRGNVEAGEIGLSIGRQAQIIPAQGSTDAQRMKRALRSGSLSARATGGLSRRG